MNTVEELNDFEDPNDFEYLDESEERYNKRVFIDAMNSRRRKIQVGGKLLFDATQIEGLTNAKNKTM